MIKEEMKHPSVCLHSLEVHPIPVNYRNLLFYSNFHLCCRSGFLHVLVPSLAKPISDPWADFSTQPTLSALWLNVWWYLICKRVHKSVSCNSVVYDWLVIWTFCPKCFIMIDERICHKAVVIGPYCLWKLSALPLNFSYAGHACLILLTLLCLLLSLSILVALRESRVRNCGWCDDVGMHN